MFCSFDGEVHIGSHSTGSLHMHISCSYVVLLYVVSLVSLMNPGLGLKKSLHTVACVPTYNIGPNLPVTDCALKDLSLVILF